MKPSAVLGPPSSTTSRFALLALTAAAATAYVQERTASLVVPRLHLAWLNGPRSCALDAQAAARRLDAVALTSGFESCLHRSAVHSAAVLAALVTVTLGSAVLMYLLHPPFLFRGRWRSAYDIEVLAGASEHVGLLSEVGDALREYALADRVKVRIAALSSDRTARTFGRRGRYVIVLSFGLVVPRRGQPNLLPGVLRHELAHIRNRDIGMTYTTITLWWAFVATAAIPAVVVGAVLGPGTVPGTLLAVVIALAILWWERAAVFRAREHYADIAVPDFAPVLLASAAGSVRKAAARRRREPPLVVLGRQLRSAMTYHPSWHTRAAIYREPGLLLRAPWSESAMAGLLVGFGFPFLWNQIRQLWPFAWASEQWAVGALFGALVTGIVGLGIWRVVWRRRHLGGPRSRPVALGVSFSAGLLAGQLVVPALATGGDALWRGLLTSRPLPALAWAFVLAATMSAMFALQVLVAERWLDEGVSARRGAFAAAVIGGVLLGPLLGQWFSVLGPLTAIFTPWSLFLWATAELALHPAYLAPFVIMFLMPAAAAIGPAFRAGLRAATKRAAVQLWPHAAAGIGAVALFVVVGWSMRGLTRTRVLALVSSQQSTNSVTGGATSAFLLLPIAVAGVLCIAAACAVAEALRRPTRATGAVARHHIVPLAASASVAAPLVAPMTFLHMDFSVCTRSVLGCARLPGWNSVAGVIVWDFSLSLVPALLMAVALITLGGQLGRLVKRRVPSVDADSRGHPSLAIMRHGLAVYSVAALAAFGLAFGYFTKINTVSPSPARTPRSTLQSLAGGRQPGAITAAQACIAFRNEANRADQQTTLLPADAVDAALVRVFASSNDLVLQRMAAAGYGSLMGTNALPAIVDFQLIDDYCSLAIAPTVSANTS